MRGVVLRNGRLELGEAPDPPAPGPGQVMIEVLACGICETDLAVYDHTDVFVGGAADGGVGTYDFDPNAGIVMGHEFTGRVVEVGHGVTRVAVGDQVSGYATVVDADGHTHVAGYSNRYPGGFGERMLVQQDSLERHHPDLAPDVATLAEPLSVGEKAVQRSGIQAGDVGVVLGAGPIGLGAIAALHARGVSPIIALESSPVRQRLAAAVGADSVLNLEDPNLAATLSAQSASASQVVAFECSGEPEMINNLIYWLPREAKIMVVAAYVMDDVIRPWVAVYKSIVINFQQGDTVDAYPITLDRIVSGTIDAAAMITGRVDLNGVEQAFRELAGPNEHVRVVVIPHRDAESDVAAMVARVGGAEAHISNGGGQIDV